MQFLDFGTVFFLVVAVIIFLQLRNVLGRRTGNEKPPFDPYTSQRSAENAPVADEGKVVSLPRRPAEKDFTAIDQVAAVGTPINDGLRAIYAVDPSFTPASFVDGAKMAYEMIVTAFAKGDRKSLKNLLSKDVNDGFVAAIDEREQRGETVNFTFIGINKATITGAELKGSDALITVAIVSQMISATLDRDGKPIDGNPDDVDEIRDLWTFARDTRTKNPNWKLVATEAED